MALVHGDVPEAAEPQDDGGHEHEEEEEEVDMGLDLLARARLLCQAANEIALPMLQQLQTKPKPTPPTDKRKTKASRPSTREEVDESKREKAKPASRAKSREKGSKGSNLKEPEALPPIAQSIPEKKAKPGAKAVPTKKKKETEEEETTLPLPQIHVTDEWRKQREAEKIRQAQERAKARVVRKTNQAELPKPNQQAEDVVDADKDVREGKMEASRRRALERVKLHKLEVTEEQAKAAAAREEAETQRQQNDELVKKTEAFRHRTLQRLQAAKREAQAQESLQELAEAAATKTEDEPEDSEEKEKQRKRQEKQRRRETAERMKRQQQIVLEQQRQEQELFEKGLNEFKTKKKEQDRVAKGLAAPAKPSSLMDPVVVFEPVAPDAKSPKTAADLPTKSHTEPTAPTAVAVDTDTRVPAEHEELAEELTLSVVADDHYETTRPRAKKVPSWKQPPVPILPTECYTQKAVVSPSDSYTERFQLRNGRSSPNAISDHTFSPPHAHQKQRHRRSPSATQRADDTSVSDDA